MALVNEQYPTNSLEPTARVSHRAAASRGSKFELALLGRAAERDRNRNPHKESRWIPS